MIKYDPQFSNEKFLQFLDNVDQAFLSPLETLKNDPTSTVIKTKIDNTIFVVKRSNIRSFFYKVKRSISSSRAHRSWRSAWQLKFLSIPSIDPAAVIEERFGPFRGRSYFVYQDAPGVNLEDYFANGESSPADWALVLNRVVLMLKKLHAANYSHHDLNFRNIILCDNYPTLIDLDAMRYHPWRWNAKRAAHKDIMRFYRNCQEGSVPSEVQKILHKLLFE